MTALLALFRRLWQTQKTFCGASSGADSALRAVYSSLKISLGSCLKTAYPVVGFGTVKPLQPLLCFKGGLFKHKFFSIS